ncbi:uncharacterized protein LOC130648194 [Hydractinia symbiolongicarpus]|uniref:uncharacterized protein LOC130648194 n=1 Tax=Hydractinia symbiolongicarpus TaxID=13093 RepID=UPI00254EA440|nr:uncharacterized protein LOC130648194 [Hydractinia symbiolongicarpus]
MEGQSKGEKRKEKHVKEEDVTICIGLMEWRESECKLKIKRGKRISCKVSNMDTRMGVLIKAENKWRQYHPDFYDTEEEYCLLYESGEKVTTIPGCEEDFILHRYREEVGKDYKRIVLYLCKENDFMITKKLDQYASSDSDEPPCKLSQHYDPFIGGDQSQRQDGIFPCVKFSKFICHISITSK